MRHTAVSVRHLSQLHLSQPCRGRSYASGLALTGCAGPAFVLLPGKLGAYVSPLLTTIGESLKGPAAIMYFAAALQPSDMTRAQGALGVYGTVPGLFAGPIFTAAFYGERSHGRYCRLGSLLYFITPVIIHTQYIRGV